MPSTAATTNASIWIYFRSPQGDELAKDPRKRHLKYCTLCPQTGKVMATSGTTNAKTHLLARHGIKFPTPAGNSSRNTSQPSIQDAFRTSSSHAIPSFDKARYTRAMALLTTRRRIPFSACEWPEWQELCASLNEPVVDQLIKSRRTMER